MFSIDDGELLSYIREDVPYFDLTTYLQDSSERQASMEIYTREAVIVSCSEESARVAELLNCNVDFVLPSKTKADAGDVLIRFSGSYETVQSAWRLTQLLLEYSCKIASYAYEMREQIDRTNPKCELLVTRKHFPFAKKFCIKSIMSGGAMPHRLGLSETVLLFAHHRKVYESKEAFYNALGAIKTKALEKKIIVEPLDFADAKSLMSHGVDVLQIDKASPSELRDIVAYRDEHHPQIKILAAGGVNKNNAYDYASCGVDGIVTSSIYFCGMADMGSRLEIV